MNYSYAPISQFGKTRQDVNMNDPLTYCLTDTLDKNFQHGAIGVTSGPRSERCQTYMAQRCADKWDGYCEYFYRQNQQPYQQWPNSQIWPDTFEPHFWSGNTSSLSMGDQLLKNTAEAKYCTYPTCAPYTELFDPTNPDSPRLTYWSPVDGSGGGCIPVCRVDPKTIDDDVVMQRMLENPRAAAGTIINICNTSRRLGDDLSGTRLGAVCNRYFKNVNK